MSPTQRTLAELRKQGFTAYVVEKWNPHARIRQDLFGFIDILAMKPCEPLLAIQACVTGDISKRRTKIEATPLSQWWLTTGSRLEVWGWSKKGPRGQAKHWTLTQHVYRPGVTLTATSPGGEERWIAE